MANCVDQKHFSLDQSDFYHYKLIECKAMRKTFFSVFLCFAKDETDFLPYSNIDSKKYSGSVLAKVSRNNAEVNAELEVRNHCTKIFKFICPIRK